VTSELKLFGDLLVQLWMSHQRPWNYRSAEANEIYRDIGDLYPSFVRREDLEAFLPTANNLVSDFAAGRKFLYLDPCQGQPTFVPVVSLRCDFSLLEPEVRFRIGLFMRHDNEVKSIGLRFESPEGDGDGIHDYYHAQYITSFYSGAPLKGAPPWLPTSQPAMTLEADGPIGLMLSLLMSLYGLKHLAQLALALTGDLSLYVNDFAPHYWLVQSTQDHFKYKTWKSPDRFKTRAEARHRGCTIASIDAATFRAEDGRARHFD